MTTPKSKCCNAPVGLYYKTMRCLRCKRPYPEPKSCDICKDGAINRSRHLGRKEQIAMNIVHQIGDALFADVNIRQSTNDQLIMFVVGMLDRYAQEVMDNRDKSHDLNYAPPKMERICLRCNSKTADTPCPYCNGSIFKNIAPETVNGSEPATSPNHEVII